MKYYLSMGAVIAALAVTTVTGLAQSTTNSSVPGSPGYSGAAESKAAMKKNSVPKMKTGSGIAKTNSDVPGSPGFTGASQGTDSMRKHSLVKKPSLKSKPAGMSKTNSTVPGSPGFTGSSPGTGSGS